MTSLHGYYPKHERVVEIVSMADGITEPVAHQLRRQGGPVKPLNY